MKKSKKFLSVLCAVCVLFAMSVSASAATLGAPTYRLDPSYQPERYAGEISAYTARMLKMLTPDTDCFVPYQNTSGTNGETLFAFNSGASSKVSWRIDWNQSGTNDVYYYQIWRVNGAGIPDSKVGSQKQASFGGVASYDNMISNVQYYIKVSSLDVPKDDGGASCKYAYELS